jgi:hypothetical protein
MEHDKSQRSVGWQWMLFAAIVLMLGLAYAWRLYAQAPAAQPGTRAVGRLSPLPVAAAAPDNQPRDMGGTFYFLESRARKLTARFADGTAIAERGLDGNIRTRSTDASGNDVGKLSVDLVSARDAEMLYEANGSQVFYAPVRPDVRPTLDWAAMQAQALRRDSNPATVEWQGRFARARGARGSEEAATEVITEFDREITARTILVMPKPGEAKRPSTLTRLYDAGVEVGEVAWVPSQKLLMWSFKGLTKGVISEETLKKSSSGGWTFQPSMAWANIQALAFYTFHEQLARNGTARATATEPRGWARKLTDAILPAVEANAPGCDGMHWMDGSVFRPCCDAHDLCYVKAGCNQYSWYWPPAMSWSCTACNTIAVYCFYTTVGLNTGTCVYMPGACQW